MTEAAPQPLLASDPLRLGRYDLTGRLGEGGMGTVYLARTPEGRPVAVKIIRPELAHDPEFRGRFRSEVERARQVPPFCTAEVLDADPDHAMPYLVVEYVEGPSLAWVVADRGPLTPGNLQGLAIGVATALTAIHGAGVIHRDLKPSNVLLAPGSPKVIDFGIARAVTAAGGPTRADQMLGTMAYMAPERFDASSDRALTPAADIFAWGAVVAYAGTGRTPFAADLPHLVAARILTQPPTLDGLERPLRGLVEHALAKDPTHRPTARDLLDRLLAGGLDAGPAAGPPGGPAPTGGVAAAFASQPALRAAAEEARAATDHQVPGNAAPAGLYGRPVPRRSWSQRAVPALAAASVVALLALAGIVFVALSRDGGSGPAGSTTPVPPEEFTRVAVQDPLTAQGPWQAREDAANLTTCTFDSGLVVAKETVGPYRCPGPTTNHTDFSAAVTVKLLNAASCASVWFRFNQIAGPDREAGYLLRICADGYTLLTHGLADPSEIAPLHEFPFANRVSTGTAIRVGVSARGETFAFVRDGRAIGTWRDGRFASGRVVLGVAPGTGEPPYRVSFADVEIRTP